MIAPFRLRKLKPLSALIVVFTLLAARLLFPASLPASEQEREYGVIELKPWVDNLNIRNEPNPAHPPIDTLYAGASVFYTPAPENRSDTKYTFTLRGTEITKPFIKVRYGKNKTGWVFEGGLKAVRLEERELLGDSNKVDAVLRNNSIYLGELGWRFDNSFVSESKHSFLYVITRSFEVQKAVFEKTLNKEESLALKTKRQIMCEYPSNITTYHTYRVNQKAYLTQRAFYMLGENNTKSPGDIKVGYDEKVLKENELSKVFDRLGIAGAYLYQYKLLEPKNSSYNFFLFAVYENNEAKQLIYQGAALLDERRFVINTFSNNLSEEGLCDGCPMLDYYQSFTYVFDVINTLVFEKNDYPMLYLDTSTVEGRAISLVYFDNEGAHEHRDYEYFVPCLY